VSSSPEPKHIAEEIKPKRKLFTFKKDNAWVPITLIFVFLLVLFLNSYFNITSGISYNPDGAGLDKFYLSGPDPYYNMRIVNQTLFGPNAGHYQFYSSNDPLLNYPLTHSGGRPPFLNMMAIGFSRLLMPFMNEVDAVGYSMQFVPALFGALLVFPVYFIGKILFNKKAGLIAALLIALIPVELSSGHGSSYSLFDHDSLNLLLFFLTYLFLIKSIKDKDSTKSILYAILGGIFLGALNMTWVESQFVYAVIAVYVVVQMLIDIFTNKIETKIFRSSFIVLAVGYLIYLPVGVDILGGFRPNLPLYLCIIIGVFGLAYVFFGIKKIPWTISLPSIFTFGVVGLILLYFMNVISATFTFLSPLTTLSEILYGSGIYGSKVSMTIAEASTSGISTTVMSFGPALYWIAWVGLVFLMYYYYKDKQRRDYLFIIVLFIVDMWLLGIAGRFINDLVPPVALLCGFVVWMIIDKVDYKQMIRNIRGAGGGLHGIRRGVKILHIFGILFIAFLIVLPNAYLAFDAAVPADKKTEFFGESLPQGAFGLGHGKEIYWVDAYSWLNRQDTDIQDPVKRPGFISWWDYGFYEVAVGGHPTVADNFQDGIPTAANFHTATSEEEAVSVWIVRLLEGDLADNNGKLSDEVIQILNNSLGPINSSNIINWIENPTSSPSYDAPIGEEYNKELSKDWRVGTQWPTNAVYHDVTKLLVDNLDDEGITWLYHNLQQATGYSIRYYGVEGYDKQIFRIFGFLADKSLSMLIAGGRAEGNPEDAFEKILFTGYRLNADGSPGASGEWSYDELNNMSATQRSNIAITNTKTVYKDAYFDTMFYRTYIGPSSGSSGSKSEPNYQLPCIDMRHFYAEYASNITKGAYYTNKVPVIIAKYYEGAYINGSLSFMGNPLSARVVIQKDLDHYNTTIPIDYDSSSTVDGNFSLLAPAGAKLQVRRILGDATATIKNVTFDGVVNSEYAPISDDDAMRKSNNYERFLNISIEPANISGYIFDDKDYDEVFNSSVDQPVNNINIVVTEILSVKSQINPTTGQTQQTIEDTGKTVNVTNGEDGYYNISGLLPGLYRLEFYNENNYLLDIVDLELYEGNNSYNVKKPKPGNIEGKVFYDENLNDNYDIGEEITGAEVKIYRYDSLTGEEKLEGETTTSTNGNYSFKELFPGKINGRNLNTYILRATKLPDYTSESTVYPVENETIIENISIGLVPVNVSGYTKHDGKTVSNITINFEPDKSIDKNTAKSNTNTSIADGSYSLQLSPGYYNVSVSKKEGQTLVYSFTGKLTLQIGDGTKTFDIVLEKHSVTVNGITKYNGIKVANISIDFLKNNSVKNNTAVNHAVKSDEDGDYTVELTPGTYNVSVNQTVSENGKNVTYTFSRELVVLSGETVKTFDIVLAKETE